MRFRSVARWCALAGVTAALAAAGPALSDPGRRPPEADRAGRLPECAPGNASTRPPSGPAGPDTPGACRAGVGRSPESAVRVDRLRESTTTATTPGGYHHLGAGTGGEWGGVTGRISVVDGSVRRNTYDFVAARFMVKRDLGAGRIAWLEAGWAETGWAGAGRQQIYTFNTNTRTWQFYDRYAVKPGDRVWIDLHTDADNVWQAWLWWNNRWNLLTAQKLPIGSAAYVEQYVEVHVDPARRARVTVPTVTVDNVQLRPAGGGGSRYWRDDVSTLTADSGQQQRTGGFCLNWLTRYDTWTAGDCPGLRLLKAAPEPSPTGEVEPAPAD